MTTSLLLPSIVSKETVPASKETVQASPETGPASQETVMNLELEEATENNTRLMSTKRTLWNLAA